MRNKLDLTLDWEVVYKYGKRWRGDLDILDWKMEGNLGSFNSFYLGNNYNLGI